jgi:uncharacterized UBP type Zn finger protein
MVAGRLCRQTLLGRGHPEFSTNRQQDSMEYYQHVLQILERFVARLSALPPAIVHGAAHFCFISQSD